MLMVMFSLKLVAVFTTMTVFLLEHRSSCSEFVLWEGSHFKSLLKLYLDLRTSYLGSKDWGGAFAFDFSDYSYAVD